MCNACGKKFDGVSDAECLELRSTSPEQALADANAEIDAEVAAGALTERQAVKIREEVQQILNSHRETPDEIEADIAFRRDMLEMYKVLHDLVV